MGAKQIAPHETFEIHELLTFKNICATKSATMSGMVTDQELKSLMQNDFTLSQAHIKELVSLLQSSGLNVQDMENAQNTDRLSRH